MKLNKSIKVILGALATIFLGAIGSGLWERVLSPLLRYLSNLVTSTLSSISSVYSNSIYSRAANLYFDPSTDSLGKFVILLISIFLFIYALNSMKENKYMGSIYHLILSVYQGWVGIIVSGSYLIVVLFLISNNIAIRQIQSYSARQMEIVRPYIGEEKYFQIRSDYLRIRSREDFDNFLRKLYDSAKAGSVNIEKFVPK